MLSDDLTHALANEVKQKITENLFNSRDFFTRSDYNYKAKIYALQTIREAISKLLLTGNEISIGGRTLKRSSLQELQAYEKKLEDDIKAIEKERNGSYRIGRITTY